MSIMSMSSDIQNIFLYIRLRPVAKLREMVGVKPTYYMKKEGPSELICAWPTPDVNILAHIDNHWLIELDQFPTDIILIPGKKNAR